MKIKKKELCFWIGILLLLIKQWFNDSAIDLGFFDKYMIFLAYISLGIHIFSSKITVKEFRGICCFIGNRVSNFFSFILY